MCAGERLSADAATARQKAKRGSHQVNPSRFIVWLVVWPMLLAGAQPVSADVTIRTSKATSGPYDLTVYSRQEPNYDVVGVSVAVRQKGTSTAVEDARVRLTAEPIDHQGVTRSFEATRGEVQGEVYHTVALQLPMTGRWRLQVQVASDLGDGATAIEVDTRQKSLIQEAEFQLLLIVIPAFFIMWQLDRLGKAGRRRARS